MSEKIWMGGIYIKDEGGYEIIIKSLVHYKKRLKTFNNSPEIKDAAAMFASVLNQQAMKTIPKIEETIEKIKNNLDDSQSINKLTEDRLFLEKALTCYKADIQKAKDTGHEYFMKLIGDIKKAEEDLTSIKTAIEKINQYSE